MLSGCAASLGCLRLGANSLMFLLLGCREVDEELANEIRNFRSPTDDETRMFYEIVIAPSYTPAGLERLKGKSKTLRILEAKARAPEGRQLRQVAGMPRLGPPPLPPSSFVTVCAWVDACVAQCGLHSQTAAQRNLKFKAAQCLPLPSQLCGSSSA